MRILSDIHCPSSSRLLSQFQRIGVPLQADSVSQLSGIRKHSIQHLDVEAGVHQLDVQLVWDRFWLAKMGIGLRSVKTNMYASVTHVYSVLRKCMLAMSFSSPQ